MPAAKKLDSVLKPGAPVSGAEPLWRQALREPVALGLAPVIFLRPLVDGATWPTDNFYFVWAIMGLACVFLARMLMRGSAPRFQLGTLLLWLFFVVGACTLATTVQYSVTYRSVVILAGHFFVFFGVVNGVRSRLAIRIVVGAMVAAFVVEVAYALIHFYYILPMARRMVMGDSYILTAGSGVDGTSGDWIHRLQTNRAAGSLLFPNALACFLILAIPITFAELVGAVFGRVRGAAAVAAASPLALVLTVCLTWLAGFCVAFFLVPLLSPGFGLPFIVFAVVLPVVLAGAVGVALKRGGWAGLGAAWRLSVLPLLLAGELWMLWLTYSRGGMLAITAAVALMWGVLKVGRPRLRARAPAAAVLLLAAILVSLAGAGVERAEPATASVPAAEAQPGGLTSEGRGVTASDLANTATFRLRWSYWRTGLRMAADNFWTGVGLGNFGAVYPNYRPANAGPVTKAHNDYLQTLCETGFFGFALFCAFWVYVVWWGLSRIRAERDRRERWGLIGIYTGLLAFLAHSAIDFNFQNPSLAFFAYVCAGLLISRGQLNGGESAPGAGSARRPAAQLAAVPLLVAAALVAGMGFRVYISEFIKGRGDFIGVGDSKKLDRLYYEAGFFFPNINRTKKPPPPRQIPVTHLAMLVPPSVLQELGEFLMPGSRPGSARRLRPDEPVTEKAIYVVRDVDKAKLEALPYAEAWLAQLKDADSDFPYEAELSAELAKWYGTLAKSLPEGESRSRCVLEYVQWARASVERSPRECQYHMELADALWVRATIEPDPARRRRWLEDALESFKNATELFPSSPEVLREYGTAVRSYGTFLSKAGDAETARRQEEASDELMRRADALDAAQLRF